MAACYYKPFAWIARIYTTMLRILKILSTKVLPTNPADVV